MGFVLIHEVVDGREHNENGFGSQCCTVMARWVRFYAALFLWERFNATGIQSRLSITIEFNLATIEYQSAD